MTLNVTIKNAQISGPVYPIYIQRHSARCHFVECHYAHSILSQNNDTHNNDNLHNETQNIKI